LLHALRYPQSERVFAGVALEEPACAMAYWGIAMSRLKRPIAASPAAEDFRAAREAIAEGLGAHTASPRETAYVRAVGGLVTGAAGDWHDRTLGYERAMEAIVR